MKDHYRLARVSETFPDQKGLVRTVRVKYRKKNPKEPKTVCTSKNLVEEKVAVQRLQLLQAAADDHIKEVEQEDSKLVEEVIEYVANEEEVNESIEEVTVSKEPLRVKVQVDDEKYEMIADIIEAKVKK